MYIIYSHIYIYYFYYYYIHIYYFIPVVYLNDQYSRICAAKAARTRDASTHQHNYCAGFVASPSHGSSRLLLFTSFAINFDDVAARVLYVHCGDKLQN